VSKVCVLYFVVYLLELKGLIITKMFKVICPKFVFYTLLFIYLNLREPHNNKDV